MSDTVESGEFLDLIDQFLHAGLSADEFCSRFIPLWMRHRDATLARKQSWPRPYDQELLAAWRRGELSDDAVSTESAKLWGYDPTFQRMIDAIHSACSMYRADPAEAWEIGEPELRRDVRRAMERHKSKADQAG